MKSLLFPINGRKLLSGSPHNIFLCNPHFIRIIAVSIKLTVRSCILAYAVYVADVFAYSLYGFAVNLLLLFHVVNAYPGLGDAEILISVP